MASRQGNYGIGAVAVVTDGHMVEEFPAGSAMASGMGVVDHAETRALLAVGSASPPAAEYSLPADMACPPPGLTVYGTLEPCPLCVCAMTNAGVVRSVSAVLDGRLVEEGGWVTTDGSAHAIGAKSVLQPRVWREIQRNRSMSFELLAHDPDLAELSWEIFAASRQNVDDLISNRPPLYQRAGRATGHPQPVAGRGPPR